MLLEYLGPMAVYIPPPHVVGTLRDKGFRPKNALVRVEMSGLGYSTTIVTISGAGTALSPKATSELRQRVISTVAKFFNTDI
jgi:hypothetical protein